MIKSELIKYLKDKKKEIQDEIYECIHSDDCRLGYVENLGKIELIKEILHDLKEKRGL